MASRLYRETERVPYKYRRVGVEDIIDRVKDIAMEKVPGHRYADRESNDRHSGRNEPIGTVFAAGRFQLKATHYILTDSRGQSCYAR